MKCDLDNVTNIESQAICYKSRLLSRTLVRYSKSPLQIIVNKNVTNYSL